MPQLSFWSLPSLLRPFPPLLFCLFLSSPSLPPPLPEKVPYNPFFEFSEPLEDGPFWMSSPVPLLSLPGSPNPFCMLPKRSSNLFEERAQESSHTGGSNEVELFFCKEVKELTTCNLLLAMQVDELKKQLECENCFPKRLCKVVLNLFQYICITGLNTGCCDA